MATKTKKKSNNVTSVIMDQAAIAMAKVQIVGISEQIMKNTDEIKNLVKKYEEYWSSNTATYHKNNLIAKINEIEQEQETLNNNLKKFFKKIVESYEKTEKSINNNASQFK